MAMTIKNVYMFDSLKVPKQIIQTERTWMT